MTNLEFVEPRWKFEDELSDIEEIVSQGRPILVGEIAHASHSRLSPEDCSVIDRFSLKSCRDD